MDRYWLLSWTTYATWLPGDPRGSVTSVREGSGSRCEHDQPGTPYERPMPGLHNAAQASLNGRPIYLNQEQARTLFPQFQETAGHRGWWLGGVAIMANHIHIVVGVLGDPDPERVAGDFKSYGSRVLNGRWGKPPNGSWWTRGSGSQRKLPTAEAVERALEYLRQQAFPLLIWIAGDDTAASAGEPGASASGVVPRGDRPGEPGALAPGVVVPRDRTGEPGALAPGVVASYDRAGEPGALAPGVVASRDRTGEPGALAPGVVVPCDRAGEPGALAPGETYPIAAGLSVPPGADAPGSPTTFPVPAGLSVPPGADAPGSPATFPIPASLSVPPGADAPGSPGPNLVPTGLSVPPGADAPGSPATRSWFAPGPLLFCRVTCCCFAVRSRV